MAVRGVPKSINRGQRHRIRIEGDGCLGVHQQRASGSIRPGRPVENGFIESFNGKLCDECLNVEVFFTLVDACRKLELWQHDYTTTVHTRPWLIERRQSLPLNATVEST